MAKIRSFREQRKIILLCVISLSLMGILFVYSASCVYAMRFYNNMAYFFTRQIIFFLISLAVFVSILFIDVGIVREYVKELLLGTVLLLVVVLVIGKSSGGAKRWLSFGPVSFQPSELLKITFLVYGVDYFVRKKALMRSFKEGVFPLLCVAGGLFILILLEPDLGTVLFWIAWIFLMFFVIKVKAKHLLFLLVCGVIGAFILVKAQPYRFNRLLSYLNPWADPQGSGFQLIQSQIAFGEGGLIGTGLGAGKQKLLFLPAAHTDFIFSIIAEEVGFLGAAATLGIYWLLFFTLARIALQINERYPRYLCLGISFIIGLEVIINLGVSSGFFPTKGMPLPFISYGGTNLLIHYMLIGIFFNITRDYELLCESSKNTSYRSNARL